MPTTPWWDEPSWPVPDADDRSSWESLADPAAAAVVVERAAVALAEPWPQLPAHGYARIHRDGDRDSYEQVLWAREARLSDATVAAAVTGQQRFLDDVADGAWLLCEQTSWCWPAHDDAHDRTGAVLADVERPYLDLGAGEVVAQLAWIDHLLGRRLDRHYPGLRKRLRVEADRRVFTPLLERHDWHWLGLDGNAHNWTAWIHANVLVAALALAGPGQRGVVIDRCLAGLRRFVAALPPDGAIDEGSGYWWNGACRALEAAWLARCASGGQVDLIAESAALRASVAFPHQMHLGHTHGDGDWRDGDWTVSFADAQARRDHSRDPWHALFQAARAVGDTDAATFALAHRVPGQPSGDRGLGRQLAALLDREWTDHQWATRDSTPREPVQAPYPGHAWFPSVEVLVARERPGSPTGLTLAIKGGHNGEHHNHNDVGSIIVALEGVPVIVDPGRPTYRLGMFGPDRYDTWVLTSDAHSVPIAAGRAQRPGPGHAARLLSVEATDILAAVEFDLSGAYGLPDGAWRRSARLDRDDRAVVITDRWQLPAEPASRVQFMLAGEVEQMDEQGLRVGGPGRWARLRFSTGMLHLEPCPLDDPMLTSVWGPFLTRAVLKVDGLTELTTTVTALP